MEVIDLNEIIDNLQYLVCHCQIVVLEYLINKLPED